MPMSDHGNHYDNREDKTKLEIIEKYKQILNCLEIMDFRTVTSIGIRYFLYFLKNGYQRKIVLISIWRSRRLK